MEVECVPYVSPNVLTQRWTNLGCQIAMTTEFCALAPNICGSSVWTCFMSPFWSFEFFRKFVHPCVNCFRIDSLIKYSCHVPFFFFFFFFLERRGGELIGRIWKNATVAFTVCPCVCLHVSVRKPLNEFS